MRNRDEAGDRAENNVEGLRFRYVRQVDIGQLGGKRFTVDEPRVTDLRPLLENLGNSRLDET